MVIQEKKSVQHEINWEIPNFTVDFAEKQEIENPTDSSEFTVVLGSNKTKWVLQVIPNNHNGCVGVFLKLISADSMDFKMDHSFKYNTKNGSKMGKVFERCDPSFHFEKPLKTSDLISHYPLFLTGKDFYLPNDVFTILFEMEMWKEDSIMKTDDFEMMLEAGWDHNLLIKTSDEQTIEVHKNILNIRCPKFMKMYEDQINLNKNTITVNAEHDTLFEFFRYIYCGRVKKMDKYAEKVLALFDMYKVENLNPKFIQWMMENITSTNAVDFLITGHLNQSDALKEKSSSFIKMNYDEVKLKSDNFKRLNNYPELAIDETDMVVSKVADIIL